MAISLSDQHELATNGEFINRIRQAACTVAFEVIEEVQGVMTDDEMIARNALARNVINNAHAAAQRAAFTLATQSPTAEPTAINDASYLTFLRDEWTKLAGYNPNLPSTQAAP